MQGVFDNVFERVEQQICPENIKNEIYNFFTYKNK